MRKYLDKFLTHLEVEKNYSPHTLLNYKIDLKEFSPSFSSDVIPGTILASVSVSISMNQTFAGVAFITCLPESCMR